MKKMVIESPIRENKSLFKKFKEKLNKKKFVIELADYKGNTIVKYNAIVTPEQHERLQDFARFAEAASKYGMTMNEFREAARRWSLM